MSDAVERWLALLVALGAAIAALVYLIRLVWKGFHVVEVLALLVNHELRPNSGSSMKDDVAAIARAVGALQLDVSDLLRDVADSKVEGARVHELLQIQLDGITHDIGRDTDPAHKREDPLT